ncbi:MAG: YgaP-like transmembrane domain [Halobacteriales archaeon]
MQPNVGGYDRLGRLVVGVVLLLVSVAGYAGFVRLAFGPFPQALTAVFVGVVGIVLLVTAATRRCPLNTVAGVDTSERGRD